MISGVLGGLLKTESVCETPLGSEVPKEIGIYPKPYKALGNSVWFIVLVGTVSTWVITSLTNVLPLRDVADPA